MVQIMGMYLHQQKSLDWAQSIAFPLVCSGVDESSPRLSSRVQLCITHITLHVICHLEDNGRYTFGVMMMSNF